MKAIVKLSCDKGFKLIDVPDPRIINHDDVVIKLKFVSICGSDLHLYYWDKWAQSIVKKMPVIVGHEGAGEVVEVGKGTQRIKVGDFVAIESHIFCQNCFSCSTGNPHLCENLKIIGFQRDGVFAEYICLPERVLWKLPDNFPKEFSSLLEPVGNPVYACLDENLAMKDVLITGAGPAGLICTQLCRLQGAAKIIVVEPQEFRRNLASIFGADYVFAPKKDESLREEILKLTSGKHGVDYVFEMSGAQQGINLGLEVIRNAGTFIAFGITKSTVEIDYAKNIVSKGITIKAILGRKIYDTWFKSTELVASGKLKLDKLVTHRFSLWDFQKAFDLFENPEINCGKICLHL